MGLLKKRVIPLQTRSSTKNAANPIDPIGDSSLSSISEKDFSKMKLMDKWIHIGESSVVDKAKMSSGLENVVDKLIPLSKATRRLVYENVRIQKWIETGVVFKQGTLDEWEYAHKYKLY
mgnify:CR=1 FL=1|tara:strand:+ start:54 stop:410 length:357 start_codon:yes stop_codon:yes gene_type:complete